MNELRFNPPAGLNPPGGFLLEGPGVPNSRD